MSVSLVCFNSEDHSRLSTFLFSLVRPFFFIIFLIFVLSSPNLYFRSFSTQNPFFPFPVYQDFIDSRSSSSASAFIKLDVANCTPAFVPLTLFSCSHSFFFFFLFIPFFIVLQFAHTTFSMSLFPQLISLFSFQ